MPAPARSSVPDCLRCRSYYVTYEPAHPHGCRRFGFKSWHLPRDEVRASTGRECELFEARPSPPAPPPSR